MSYRSIQLIVPVQYVAGVHKTQTIVDDMFYFDQDPRTYSSPGLTGDGDLTTVDTCTPTWCFFDADEQIRVSDTGVYNIEGDGNAIALTSYHAEVGKSSAWTVSTPAFHRNDTNTEQYQSLLLKLNNSTAYDTWGFDVVGTIISTGYNAFKRGLWFSKDFAVPLFNRRHTQNESFKTESERTKAGNLFDDWIAARNNQVIVIHTFTWTDLTVAQYAVFERFFDAFNGNIQQPFVMCRLHNEGSAPNYEMQFWRLLIQDDSLQIEKTKGDPPRYSVSFSAQEMLINY